MTRASSGSATGRKTAKLVDMSHIPGGYGIYILPYVQSEADGFPDTYQCADQLACFFPLDPAVEIRGTSG